MTQPDLQISTPPDTSNYDGQFNFADLSGAISAVPELQTSPSLAGATAQAASQGLDATGTAQALVGVAQHAGTVAVAQRAHKDGWFGGLLNTLDSVRTGIWDHIPGHDAVDSAVQNVINPAGNLLHLAGVPLGSIQHQYRFIRDVFERHGTMAGLAELGAGAIGAGVGGLIGSLAGPAGIALGAKLGAEGIMQLSGSMGPFGDSWDRTANGEAYQPHGHPVSLGRDVAGLIGLSPKGNGGVENFLSNVPIVSLAVQGLAGGNVYKAVSGAIDAAADVGADPVLNAGKLAQLGKAKTVLTSYADFAPIQDAVTALDKGAMTYRMPSGAVMTPLNPTYRMMKDVAGSNTGDIIAHYPTLRSLAPQLDKASTVPEVAQVFADNLGLADMLGTRGLASYSVVRAPFRAAADVLRNTTPDVLPADATVAEQAAALPSNTAKGITETIVRNLSNRTPFTVDPVTREMQTTGFDINNPAVPGLLYKIVRTTESHAVAAGFAARFGAETDPALKFDLWNRAHAQVVTSALAKYGVDDPKVVERVISDLSDRGSMASESADSIYAYGPDGNPVDRLPVNGGEASAGSPMWEGQAGKLYTIHPSTLDSVGRALSPNRVSRLYGALDDGVYNNVMAPFLKPQMLLSGGFALRNSNNELMTRIIGGDGLKVLRSAVEKTAAKLDYKLNGASPQVPDEIDHLTAGLSEVAHPQTLLDNQSLTETATRSMIESGGHMLPPAAQAGHKAGSYGGDKTANMKDDLQRVIAAATGRGNAGTRLDPHSFVDYTSADGGEFGRAMSGALSMVARDPRGVLQAKAFRDALNGGASVEDATQAGRDAALDFLQNTDRGKFQASLLKSGQVPSTSEVHPLVDWSARSMEAIKGLVTGQNGEINKTLLDGLADQNATVADRTAGGLHPNLHPDVINDMPTETLPVKVPGMQTIPIGDIGMVQRIQDKGFSILGNVMNRLSREPIYNLRLNEEYNFAKTVPGLSDEEAWQLAQTRAVQRMIPEIHNPADRSQFALAARNFLPFFFAREQSYRRLAGALSENPVGFHKLQLGAQGMKDAGFIQTDPTTKQDYFNFPLSGAISQQVPGVLNTLGINTAVGIPSGFRGSVQGLFAGGEAPDHLGSIGWSPIVSIPMRALASMDPQLQDWESKLEGPVSASQSNLAELIPNSIVRQAATAALPEIQRRSFTNAQIDALQYSIAHGDTPPNPTRADGTPDPAFSAWMDKFQTHTRIMYGLKALFGIGAPSSPQLREGSQQLTDLAQQYVTKYGLGEGTRRLFEDHPNMTSYGVFKTTPTSGLPDTQNAVEWARQNSDFIAKYGKAATFFAPQSAVADPNVTSARQAEIGLGLRAQRTPDEYVHEVVAQTGWNEYQQSKAARDAAIAAHPGDDAYAQQTRANFNAYLTQDNPSYMSLAHRNPVWYSQYLSLPANVQAQQDLVNQARQIISTGKVPAGGERSAEIITGLLRDYDKHLNSLAGVGSTGLGAQQTAAQQRQNWKDYLTYYTAQNPDAALIVNRLFKGA